MFARMTKALPACSMLAACVSGSGGDRIGAVVEPVCASAERAYTPDGEARDRDEADRRAATSNVAETEAERFRFAEQRERGFESVLLVPTAVDDLVAAGPLARSRLFLGALFATQLVGRDRVAGVGLVIKAVGGGLGPTMSALPRVVVTIDGEEWLRGSVARTAVYNVQRSRWGPEETLMFRVGPDVLEAMAAATRVELRLGDSVRLRLDEVQLADLADFLGHIPEGTRFERAHEVRFGSRWRAQQ